MAAPVYDIQRSPSGWAPPVARFFALVPASPTDGSHRAAAPAGRTAPVLTLAPDHDTLLHPDQPGHPDQRLALDEVERPTLRVIAGGPDAVRRRRRSPQVYRRRRLVAGMAAVSMVLLLAAVIAPVLHDSATAGSVSTAPSEATATVASPVAASAGVGALDRDSTYLVQPGDTLWSIAASMDAPGDIRALVDELSRRAGPGPLVAGTRLDISGL